MNQSFRKANETFVVLGHKNITDAFEKYAIPVESIIKYNEHNSSIAHNLALLTFMNESLANALLYDKPSIDTNATILGWGYQDKSNRRFLNNLQSVEVKTEECAKENGTAEVSITNCSAHFCYFFVVILRNPPNADKHSKI